MKTPADKKREFLCGSGTLNPHPESVKSDLFNLPFFDRHDRAQVKYEMLRTHSVDGETVVEACRKFGFSREGFYRIEEALSKKGFGALLPEKRGRKGPTKLKDEVLRFAADMASENPAMTDERLAARIEERFGVRVHRTTVTRGVKKKALADIAGAKERGS